MLVDKLGIGGGEQGFALWISRAVTHLTRWLTVHPVTSSPCHTVYRSTSRPVTPCPPSRLAPCRVLCGLSTLCHIAGGTFHIFSTCVRISRGQLLFLPNSPSTSPSPHHHLSLIWAFSDPDYPNPPGRFQNQVIMKDSLHYGIILETPLLLFEVLL